MSATTKANYINGSDLLLTIGGKAVGHATSHKCTFNAESKEHSVKPAASAAISAGLWAQKSVKKLSVSISAEGVRNFSETEGGFKTLLAAWAAHTSVEVKAFERESDATPYMTGNFIITSLEENAPAEDDATYSISLENTGAVTITATAVTGETA